MTIAPRLDGSVALGHAGGSCLALGALGKDLRVV